MNSYSLNNISQCIFLIFACVMVTNANAKDLCSPNYNFGLGPCLANSTGNTAQSVVNKASSECADFLKILDKNLQSKREINFVLGGCPPLPIVQ
jgi:hypothetical protein